MITAFIQHANQPTRRRRRPPYALASRVTGGRGVRCWSVSITAALLAGLLVPAVAAQEARTGVRWELLETPRAPADALRLNGNARPRDSMARAVWQDAQRLTRKLSKKLDRMRVDTSRAGAKARSRLARELARVNPVICRARIGSTWYPGRLLEAAGTCALFKQRSRVDKRRCNRDRGPHCQHHIPILGAEVFVLRGARNVVLMDVDHEPKPLSAPVSAMIGGGDDIFGSTAPFCRHGDALGILTKEGRNYSCDKGGVVRQSTDWRIRSYTDLDAYHRFVLGDVARYLVQREALITDAMIDLHTITTADQAQATLSALDVALQTFHEGLTATIDGIDPAAQPAAGKLVSAKVGDLLDRSVKYRASLEATVKTLEVNETVLTFWTEQTAPLVERIRSVSAREATPTDLPTATRELAEVDALTTALEQMDSKVKALPARVRTRLEKHIASVAKDLERSVARVVARQESLRAIVTSETQKTEADTLAAKIKAALARAAAHQDTSPETLATIGGLDALLGRLDGVVTEQSRDPLVKRYRREAVEPLRPALVDAIQRLEAMLPGADRVARLKLTYASIEDREIEISTLKESLGHAKRLLDAGDEPELQMNIVMALANQRGRVLTVLSQRVDAGWRCASLEDCDDGLNRTSANRLLDAMDLLPTRVGGRTRSKPGQAFAKELVSNGVRWSWPKRSSEDPESEDAYSGPTLSREPEWLSKQLKGAISPPVTAWLSCREGQLAGATPKPKDLLKRCTKAMKTLPEGPLADDIDETLIEAIGQFDGRPFSTKCTSLRRTYRRAFFADSLNERCEVVKANLKREKAIARWQKKIEKAIKKKKFDKARSLLTKLAEADGEAWRITNLGEAIDQAESDLQSPPNRRGTSSKGGRR